MYSNTKVGTRRYILMRTFYKYWIEPGKGKESRSIEKSFDSHSSAMGGYNTDKGYENKEKFLYVWFLGKYVNYDSFIRRFISKNESILSVASGRCINELKLIQDGYDIVCSDISIPLCYVPSKKIFGNFEFHKLNILYDIPSKKYDKIICLDLIWAFNKDEMNIFFNHIYRGLKNNGLLILEISISPDNFLSFLLHDIYLRTESSILSILSPIFGKNYKRIKETHGYKYRTEEIIQIANKNSFEKVCYFACEPLT